MVMMMVVISTTTRAGGWIERRTGGPDGQEREREKVYYMMGLDERETRQDTNKYERKGGPTVQFLLSIMNGGRKKGREKERNEEASRRWPCLRCNNHTIQY